MNDALTGRLIQKALGEETNNVVSLDEVPILVKEETTIEKSLYKRNKSYHTTFWQGERKDN